MALKKPQSMDECVYYTLRTLGEKGNGEATVWVFKQDCPKCKKAKIGKPKDAKGKTQIRAKEYICPNCKYTVQKEEYESSLTASIEYKCPNCNFSGELQIPFKRKRIKGTETLRFQCQKCKTDINVTKKMKE